jgi:hypothetical protein
MNSLLRSGPNVVEKASRSLDGFRTKPKRKS